MIRHHILAGGALATVLAMFTLSHDVAAQRQPVRTATGLLAGVPGSDPSVMVYKGVPFAAPPVGNLRWRAPQPAAAWTGVRQADQFGANCMQLIVEKRDPWTHEFMAHGPISEDCLYLNVWTAAGTATERRPRALTSHIGAGSVGSTAPARSTRSTSAPMSDSIMAANGPGPIPASSTTRYPASGPATVRPRPERPVADEGGDKSGKDAKSA